LASIDEVVLECDTSLQRLMQGDLCIRRFIVRRPRLRLERTADGAWNTAGLFDVAPCSGEQMPRGGIESGAIEIIDASRQPPARYVLREIDVSMEENNDDQGPLLRASGTLAGDYLQQAKISVERRTALRSTKAEIKLDDIELSPALLASLPGEAAEKASALAALRGRADLQVTLTHVSGREQPWQFQAIANLRDGRLDHPRWPHALSQLQAKVRASNAGLEIEHFTASHRQTTLRMNAWRRGWSPNSPAHLHVDAKQVVFDQRMMEILPPAWQEIWQEFLPEGEGDVNATLAFDGQSWHPEVTLTARNMSGRYFRFPYQIQQVGGWFKAQGKHLRFDFTGKACGAPVRIEGEIHDFGPPGSGRVDISGKRLQFDAALIAAMPPESRTIVQAFQPRGGFFDLAPLRLWWRPNDPEIHRQMVLRVYQAFGRYERFPYPLSNVSGVIEQLSDNEWRFSDFQAASGSGRITCRGSLQPLAVGQIPNPPGQVQNSSRPAARASEDLLQLNLHADKLALNDELRHALPQGTQRLWTNLRPQGLVDLNVMLKIVPSGRHTSLTVAIVPWEESVSIEPSAFSYRWEKLRGQMIYTDGVAELRGLEATHGDTRWRAHGEAKVSLDGSWALALRDLQIDRLHVDRDLLRAVPEAGRKTLVELNPTGAFNLHGEMSFAQGGHPADSLRAAWNMAVVCHGNSLHAGVKLENLFGVVYLEGQSRNGEVRGSGRLALDSASYRGFQFTEVQGPLTIEPDFIILGSPSEPRLQAGSQHLSARCYDGVLHGDAWIRRERSRPAAPDNGNDDGTSPQAFALRAQLQGASLGRFAREAVVGRQNLSGRVDGTLVLGGTAEGARGLKGAGNIRLREANLYELPVMLSLLKVLSLKEPDTTAFNTGDVEFLIKGDHGQVYFPRIDLDGDALTLRGRGSMGFDKQLALVFQPQLGSRRNQVPIFSALLRSASGQVVELYVGGTLDQPGVRREPFPAVKEALENLQPPVLPSMTPDPSTLLPNLSTPPR
jgi:hypothetical protein